MNILKSISRRAVRQLGKWRLLSPETTARYLSRIILDVNPDLDNPSDMNEVILFLSLRTDTSEWPGLADKYNVRNFIENKIGSDILIPLYQVVDSPEEINFEELPDSFVIKTTDGFARTLIIKDKNIISQKKIIKKLNKWMREKHVGDEPHYLKIRRRLVIEKLLPGKNNSAPIDYKFICINGEPLYCLACSNRSMETFRSEFSLYRLPDWTDTDGISPGWESKDGVEKPELLEKMMEYSRILAKGFPLVRIDLYQVEGEIYFGEITFTSAAGREMKIKQKMLDEIGKQVVLTDIKRIR